LDYIEACVDELSGLSTAAHIILGGDLKQMSNEDIEERTGLKQIVCQPTMEAQTFSNPLLFSTISVVTSVVSSDHKAIVQFAGIH